MPTAANGLRLPRCRLPRWADVRHAAVRLPQFSVAGGPLRAAVPLGGAVTEGATAHLKHTAEREDLTADEATQQIADRTATRAGAVRLRPAGDVTGRTGSRVHAGPAGHPFDLRATWSRHGPPGPGPAGRPWVCARAAARRGGIAPAPASRRYARVDPAAAVDTTPPGRGLPAVPARTGLRGSASPGVGRGPARAVTAARPTPGTVGAAWAGMVAGQAPHRIRRSGRAAPA